MKFRRGAAQLWCEAVATRRWPGSRAACLFASVTAASARGTSRAAYTKDAASMCRMNTNVLMPFREAVERAYAVFAPYSYAGREYCGTHAETTRRRQPTK